MAKQSMAKASSTNKKASAPDVDVRTKRKHFIIFHLYIPRLGGIEAAVYNLAKVLNEQVDVTIAFVNCESYTSLFRYAEVADVKKILPTDKIHCDTLLIASNHIQPSQITADKVLQWVHSDYKKYKLKLANNKVDQYVAVSQHAANVFNELFGVKPLVIQNIIDPDFELPTHKTRPLRLVTNSRISPEKGFARMRMMAESLREAHIPFEWWIFGDNSHSKSYEQQIRDSFTNWPEVIFFGYKDDIRGGLAWADYLVQLSDFEGCPYAVLEALKVGVPCILSTYDSASELVQDGYNGYLLPIDMQNIDYKQLANNIPKDFVFNQDGLVEEWLKVLN